MEKIGVVTTKSLNLKYPTVLSDRTPQSKNIAFKKLLDMGCDYIFWLDGVNILDQMIFEHCRVISEKTGWECILTSLNEPSNGEAIYKDSYVTYWPYPSCCFVMYTRNALEKAGLFDEEFEPGTWDDVEHIHRMGNFAFTGTWGLFVTLKDERLFLAPDPKWTGKELKKRDVLDSNMKYWQSKNPERYPITKEKPIKDKKLELKHSEGMI